MAGVAQGDRIRSQDITGIMRRINAIEDITLERGERIEYGNIVVTPGGLIHTGSANGILIFTATTFDLVLLYQLFGFGGTPIGEQLGDWGPGDDVWTYGTHLNTTPDPDELEVSFNRYAQSSGAIIERVDLDGFVLQSQASWHVTNISVGGSMSTKIYVCETSSSGAKVHRFSLSGSFENTKSFSGDFGGPEGAQLEGFFASKKVDGNYFLKKDSASEPWKEYNSSGTFQREIGSVIENSKGVFAIEISPTSFWGAFSQGDDGAVIYKQFETNIMASAKDDGTQYASNIASDVGSLGIHPVGAKDEVFSTGDGARKSLDVHDITNGDLLRTLVTYSYTNFSNGQTTFYKYPTTTLADKVSLGTPDGGVSIPALTAFERDATYPGGIVQRGNEVTDMQSAVEAVLVNYKNAVTGSAFNWTPSDADNLYTVAVDSGKDDWDETGAHKTTTREDLIDELDLCLTKLEASDLV